MKLQVEDEKGTIQLDVSDLEYYSSDNIENNTVFEFIVPDIPIKDDEPYNLLDCKCNSRSPILGDYPN